MIFAKKVYECYNLSSVVVSGMAMNLTDPSYELIDPCPDIFALFIEYNDRFFEGNLSGCEVKWSPRMTTCAGVCSYEGRGGLCSIRLSKPLLTLRPRSDLVETLLHEMIHAYLFVTVRNRDRDGHGPEFQFHMNRINSMAGTRITIYHSFHREVAELRQHWWRCDGVCKDRPPFRGYVKRASNRAPGPNDLWWAKHKATCNGTFIKIREPEGYGQKKPKKTESPSKSNSVQKKNKTLDSWVISPGKTSKPSTSNEIQVIFAGTGKILGGEPVKKPLQQRGSAVITGGKISRSEWLDRLDNNRPKKTADPAAASSSRQSWLDRLENSRNSGSNSSVVGIIPIGNSPSVNGKLTETSTSTALVSCPSCGANVEQEYINGHLDYCAD